MKVCIVKYNAGNVHSVRLALNRLGVESIVTDDHTKLAQADKVIFPGVGEASTAMLYLTNHGLDKIIKNLKQPVLGICLGLQLMCLYSEENDTPCLGIFDEKVKKFPPADKVPHMGWNSIIKLKGPLFRNLKEGDYVYFVHSYFGEVRHDTVAQSEYIVPFSAALNKNNFYAVQFHPEKSGKVGEQILKNFLAL